MTVSAGSRRALNQDVVLFLLLLALGVGIAEYVRVYVPAAAAPLSSEAVVRTGLGEDLLDGLTRGRQGFVGSAWWAPLPTLLAVPLLRMPPPVGGDRALPFVATAGAALLGVLLNAWLRRNGVRAPFRLLAVLAVFLSPPVRQCAAGGSQVLFALCGVAAACFLMHWWETDQLRSLSYLAFALMFAVITRFQAVLLFFGALAFVGLHLALRRARPGAKLAGPSGPEPEKSYAEATLIVFLMPAVYVALLWVAANWLLMGDATFFVRALPSILHSWQDAAQTARDDCGWGLLLAVGIIAFVAWALRAIGRKRGALCVELPAVAACFLLWSAPFAARVAPQDPAGRELPEVVAYLNAEHYHDWVLVSGYRGYEIARGMPAHSDRLYHVLSFYLDQALQKTKGRRTYLLVPEPSGADRWEDINLKYPDLYEYVSPIPFAVYEWSWKHWRLFRVVRNDETDRR